jgi:serine/threonine protein kinase
MGVVYEAEDTLLKRRVAVKLLAPGHLADAEAVQRFLREARAAARLNHAHVVTIHEVDRVGEIYYLVMELVRGGSVHDLLKRSGPRPWPQATRMIVDACRGLEVAHAAGLIHRDIKPSNLLCTDQGVIKLADFGLAKVVGPASAGLTTSGGVIGTPHYMSPEQWRGERVDARSDLYSLGATYYELLTGKRPFAADNVVGIQFAHCGSPVPDPRAIDPAIPEACPVIIRRAMAKEGRWASARAHLCHPP